MSAILLKTSANVALQLVTNKIKEQLSESNLQVANGEQFSNVGLLKAPQQKATTEGTFTITFSYQQNLHRTKVQFTNTGYGKQIYKVALNSALNNGSRVCWLQKNNNKWSVLLGNDVSDSLKNALTIAIEDQA